MLLAENTDQQIENILFINPVCIGTSYSHQVTTNNKILLEENTDQHYKKYNFNDPV